MSNDHAEFIAKYHKTTQASVPESLERKRYEPVWIFGLGFLFVGAGLLMAFLYKEGQPAYLISGSAITLLGFGVILAYRHYRNTLNRQNEMHLIKAVLEGSRAARMITDVNDVLIYSNQKFEHLCRGVGPPSFATLLRLFHENPDAAAHFQGLSDKAYRGLVDSIELFSRYEDRERWFMITAQPVLSYAGYIHWRIDDVTDKYMSDQAIRDEREKLIDFTDNAPVGFFSVNEDGRFVFANATFARWLGESIETLMGERTLHTYLLHPPQAGKPYDLTDDKKDRQVVEIYMKGAGGKTFLAAVNQAIVHEPDGRVMTRAIVHDLTAERKMRTALKESEARFQRFFEEAPLGIVLVNGSGIVSDCNSMFAHIVRKDISKIENQDFLQLIDAEDRHKIKNALKNIDQGKQMKAPVDVVLVGEQGRVQTQMHARRFKESGNTVLHFIDVSEQKQLETQFVQSQKMQAVGQLAGGIAHDFNNLLTAIIGFCDLLLLRHKPGDPSFSDIMQIKQNSNRAANLVRQLLAFSRQQTLQPRVQDITNILTELSHLIRRLIGANIELDLVHGEELGLVKVDEGQMEQVLINLAVNARDAMNETGQSGHLLIETENFSNKKAIELVSEELPPGHWVQIRVKDSGCGIPKDNLTRIFEPFFTTKNVGEGTGLGLATVYGIVRQTDGYLDVNSKVGEGTVFTIYLPRSIETEEEQAIDSKDAEAMQEKDLTGSESILLVEDEDAVRTFSQRALTNKGYDVLAADSGESALALIEKEKDKGLDLIITDVIMPNMDGPTLVKKIREDNKNVRVIFISGYTVDKLKEHMGPNTWFLPKPFTLKQLAAKVKEVLDE